MVMIEQNQKCIARVCTCLGAHGVLLFAPTLQQTAKDNQEDF